MEDAHALAAMSSFNRVGVLSSNCHTGLLMHILRKEWGFQGLISEDAIPPANYCVLKEAVINGITMTCKTGENNMADVSSRWDFWTVKNISRDATLLSALKQSMTWQAFALANSNVMEGVSSASHLVTVRTWYDNVLTGLQIGFALLTMFCVLGYSKALKGRTEKEAENHDEK